MTATRYRVSFWGFWLGVLAGVLVGALVMAHNASPCEPCTAESATVAGPHGNAAEIIEAQAKLIVAQADLIRGLEEVTLVSPHLILGK